MNWNNVHTALADAFAHADTLDKILSDDATREQALAWLDEEERLGRVAAEAFAQVVPRPREAMEGLWKKLDFMAKVSDFERRAF